MGTNEAFSLVYAPVVTEHLHAIERKHYSIIRETIVQQLSYEPTNETQNRKPLQRPAEFGATWEIRFGPNNRFRVFYDIEEADKIVTILAIGTKVVNRLTIGNEEIEL